MAVNAKLGVVRKVGAELQKERPEVLVDAIKIVVVDHGRRLHDPRIGRAGTRAAPTLRAHNPRFLLCLADVQHTFGLPELAQIPLGNVVLARALLESNEIDAFGSDELLDIANKGPGHRRHRRRRCKPLAMVNPQIPHRGSHRLQVGHINVEIHAVDRLVLKNHMITQHIRHGSCYPHRGLRSSTGPRTHRALSSHTQRMSLQARPGSTQINPESPLSSAQAVPIYLVGLRRSLVSCARVSCFPPIIADFFRYGRPRRALLYVAVRVFPISQGQAARSYHQLFAPGDMENENLEMSLRWALATIRDLAQFAPATYKSE